MDEKEYIRKQEEESAQYEALCKRCGACCGVSGSDPCLKLAKDANGTWYCTVYDSRIGQQLTVSGKAFTCIPIRDVLAYNLPNEGCGYAQKPH